MQIDEPLCADDSPHSPITELEVRVRALDCLYGISRLVERAEGDLNAILQGTVDLLPISWGHNRLACARAELDGRQYKSPNFVEGQWCQSAELRVNQKVAGKIEVRYEGHTPPCKQQLSYRSEQELLHAVAERIGHVIERIRAQETLRHHAQEIRDDQTHLTRVVMLGEMASMIAHEVNQPLTAIANYAHACDRLIDSDSIDDKEIKQTLGRISKQAMRAGAIIRSMKDLSARRLANHEENEVNAVILDIQPLMQLEACVRDVHLHLELGESLPAVIIDRVQIQQVIFNLVRNAIDAMIETPIEMREVAVSTLKTVEGDVEVRVADHGCGIEDCENDRIYDSFFTTKAGGMGLGLSVGHKIVASHGGQLAHTQNDGGGTVFYFSLPPASGGVHG